MTNETRSRPDNQPTDVATDSPISPDILETIIGGRSIIDARHLHVSDLEAAKAFIKAYGFDTDDNNDSVTIQNIHSHALSTSLMCYSLTKVLRKFLQNFVI